MPAYQQSFEAFERPIYFYKLNENYTGGLPASFEGISLSKEWKGFERQQPKIDIYLRTFKNPKGIMDLKVEDLNKKVYSNTEVDSNKKRIIHTREVLCTFKRKVLEDIAKQWNIDPVNKRDPFLINQIAEKQDDYNNYQDSIKDDNKIKVSEDIEKQWSPVRDSNDLVVGDLVVDVLDEKELKEDK